MTDDDILRLLGGPTVPCRVLCFGASDQTVLAWWPPAGPPALLRFAVGVQQLVEQAVRRLPPRPADLEHAIDLTEEAIGSPPLQPPAGALLQPAGLFAAVLPHLGGLERSAVEDLFQRLASWSLGHPTAARGLPEDRQFVSAVLLLRELTHHLSFERLAPAAG